MRDAIFLFQLLYVSRNFAVAGKYIVKCIVCDNICASGGGFILEIYMRGWRGMFFDCPIS